MDCNFLAINIMLTISQNFPKMVGMVRFYVNEVELAIEAQRLAAALVQPFFSGPSFFQHNDRSAGFDAPTVTERTASGKSVNKIKLKLITCWVSTKPIKVGAKIPAQNHKFGLAMLFDDGR